VSGSRTVPACPPTPRSGWLAVYYSIVRGEVLSLGLFSLWCSAARSCQRNNRMLTLMSPVSLVSKLSNIPFVHYSVVL
jgi:hypothetical protein